MRRLIWAVLMVLLCAPMAWGRGATACGGASIAATGPVYTDCSTMSGDSFLYYGDYSGDTDKGCKAGPTAIDGTLGAGIGIVSSTSDPGTQSPISGSNVIKFDSATNEYIQWTVTGSDLISINEGSIQFDIFATSTTGFTALYVLYYGPNDYISFRVASDGTIRLDRSGGGTRVYIDSTAKISDATWTTIYFRWSVSNNKQALKIGSNSWQEKSSGTVTSATNPSVLKFNCTAYADAIYIDNIKVSTTYAE